MLQDSLNGARDGAIDFDPTFVQFLDGSGSHASGDDRIDPFADECAHGLAHTVGVVLVRIVDDLDRIFLCVTNGEKRCASEVLKDSCGFSIFSGGRGYKLSWVPPLGHKYLVAWVTITFDVEMMCEKMFL